MKAKIQPHVNVSKVGHMRKAEQIKLKSLVSALIQCNRGYQSLYSTLICSFSSF